MNPTKQICFTAITLLVALAIPVSLAADDEGDHHRKHHHKHHHYELIDLGTFGGPSSWLATTNEVTEPGAINQVLNNQGTVVGWGDTSTLQQPVGPLGCFNFGCFLPLAFQWQKGVLTDLGVLPGGDASAAFWISDNGLIAEQATNGLVDPLLPDFLEERAVLWKDGKAIDLGTLGGNESGALSVNDRGQVVGFATNTIPDPLSILATQIRAFLWQDGTMQDLGTLGSGNDSDAEFVNERGQVAGWSFTKATTNPATGSPTTDPFLWEHGTMQDLGTLGGTLGFPYGLNNRGQVIGISNLAGDLTGHPFLWKRGSLIDLGTLGGSYGIAMGINDGGEVVGGANNKNDQAFLAFLWKDGVMTNLGTLNGDDCSVAFHINSEGQIVGNSFPCAGGPLHGFLWQNGFMTDLNALLPPGSSLTPEGDGAVINDRGEIAEMGVLPDGDIHAFLLVPCDENHQDIKDCDFSEVEESASAIRVGSQPVEQNPTTASPRIPGVNPMMRFFSHRTMPWYRNLGVQPPAK
jgi:probable HAF family extracellular repeat protein